MATKKSLIEAEVTLSATKGKPGTRRYQEATVYRIGDIYKLMIVGGNSMKDSVVYSIEELEEAMREFESDFRKWTPCKD